MNFTEEILDPNRRHEFQLIVDGKNTNPNGDPDLGGMPRQDLDTNLGLISPMSVKRKIRDFVMMTEADNKEQFDIFVRSRQYIQNMLGEAYKSTEEGVDSDSNEHAKQARSWVQQRYFDARMFGLVATKVKGFKNSFESIRGPAQVEWGESVHPVDIVEHGLTRVNRNDEDDEASDSAGTMGSIPVIRYGLYTIKGAYSPFDASYVKEKDMRLLWDGLLRGWKVTQSNARAVRPISLVIFTHEDKLGNASAYRLHQKVKISSSTDQPMSREDYSISYDKEMPEGVTMSVLEV